MIISGYHFFLHSGNVLLWRDADNNWVGNPSYLFEKEPTLEGAGGEVIKIHGWRKHSSAVLVLTSRGALTIFNSGDECLTEAYVVNLTPNDELKGETLLSVREQRNHIYVLVTSGGEYTLQWALHSSEFASAEVTATWTPLEELYVRLTVGKDPATLSVLQEVENRESLVEYLSKDFNVPVFGVSYDDLAIHCVVRFCDVEMTQVAMESL